MHGRWYISLTRSSRVSLDSVCVLLQQTGNYVAPARVERTSGSFGGTLQLAKPVTRPSAETGRATDQLVRCKNQVITASLMKATYAVAKKIPVSCRSIPRTLVCRRTQASCLRAHECCML